MGTVCWGATAQPVSCVLRAVDIVNISDIKQRRITMSNVQQQRMVVEQLRREAGIKRISVSQAAEDIKKFVLDKQVSDCLLVGFSSERANPFREKSWSCQII